MKSTTSKYDSLSIEDLSRKDVKARQFLTSIYEKLRDHESQLIAGWRTQAYALLSRSRNTNSLIGIVGATGAGKSALINSLLDEECVVPTNCMRACTAVPIEISYNESSSGYKAVINFISEADWRAELELMLRNILDERGNMSKDCQDSSTDAGLAFAKLQAVYADIDKKCFATSSVDELLSHKATTILGTSTVLEENDLGRFHNELRRYVDAKEKKQKADTSQVVTTQEYEVWPLIRVVHLYLRSNILSRGLQLVDLPGVHDSNAARAAVARTYIKRCSGFFVISTINRAVDDKSAQTLLGDTFKQQLKLDGNCDNITFVCTQTDHISLIEVTRNLDLSQQLNPIHEELAELKSSAKVLKQQQSTELETLKRLRRELKSGRHKIAKLKSSLGHIRRGESTSEAAALSLSRKRPHVSAVESGRKRRTMVGHRHSEPSQDIENEHELLDDSSKSPRTSSKMSSTDELENEVAELTQSLSALKSEKAVISEALKSIEADQRQIPSRITELKLQEAKTCIKARNEYSRHELKQQFAKAMQQLDEQAAVEDDPDSFDPGVELRDYDSLAKNFPVFCVSSRAYQKLSGRLLEEENISTFDCIDDTEIPQLQLHCCTAADALQAAILRRCLNEADILRNSMKIFSSTSIQSCVSDVADAEVAEFADVFTKLSTECIDDIADKLQAHIHDKVEPAVRDAKNKAVPTSARWGAPVNLAEREKGGLHWQTYRAVVQHGGHYGNQHGDYNFNMELAAPIINKIAHGWDTVFHRRIPVVLENVSAQFSDQSGKFIARVQDTIDIASLHLLKQQLEAYATKISNALAEAEAIISVKKKDIHRLYEPEICQIMSNTYARCVAEKGSGMFARMKSHMTEGVTNAKDHMFKSSTELVRAQLLDMLKVVDKNLHDCAEEIGENIRQDCTQLQATRHHIFADQETLRADIVQLIHDYEAEGILQISDSGEADPTKAMKCPQIKVENMDEDEDYRSQEMLMFVPDWHHIDSSTPSTDEEKSFSIESDSQYSSSDDFEQYDIEVGDESSSQKSVREGSSEPEDAILGGAERSRDGATTS